MPSGFTITSLLGLVAFLAAGVAICALAVHLATRGHTQGK